jgi:DNA-binding NtrC family response regulator
MPGRQLNAASRAALCAPHPWPGNVRELEHRVHRCFLLSNGPLVELGLTPGSAVVPSEDEVTSTGFVATSFAEAKARVIADFERRYVRDMLQYTQGNVSEAARLAGKERSRFGRLVRKYELHRSQD